MPKLEKQPSFSRNWNAFVGWVEKGKEELGLGRAARSLPLLSSGGEPFSVSLPCEREYEGDSMDEKRLEHLCEEPGTRGLGKPCFLYYSYSDAVDTFKYRHS
jgi:hypothetical protein